MTGMTTTAKSIACAYSCHFRPIHAEARKEAATGVTGKPIHI